MDPSKKPEKRDNKEANFGQSDYISNPTPGCSRDITSEADDVVVSISNPMKTLRLLNSPAKGSYYLRQKRLYQRCGTFYNKVIANTNPFARDLHVNAHLEGGKLKYTVEDMSKKRMEKDAEKGEASASCIPFKKCNIDKYTHEFHELGMIGHGHFAQIFECIGRLDGIKYAIKDGGRQVSDTALEVQSLHEVFAHSVLDGHPNLVRYFSAWVEQDRLFMQLEFCNGGSLQDRLEYDRVSANDAKQFVTHIAAGLKYLHSQRLVHSAIRPEHILISYIPDSSECEERQLIYKIADFGNVVVLDDPEAKNTDSILSVETMKERLQTLPKSDIHGLGLTVLESIGCTPIPTRARDIERFKVGKFSIFVNDLDPAFKRLVGDMINRDPKKRPTATKILASHSLNSVGLETNENLRQQLNREQLKNQKLTRQITATAGYVKSLKRKIYKNKDKRRAGGRRR